MIFVTNKQLKRNVKFLLESIQFSREEHWKLCFKYHALLRHFELEEIHEPNNLTFKKKHENKTENPNL